MKRISLFLIILIALSIFFGDASTYVKQTKRVQAQSSIKINQTCHAEVRWNYLTNMRRGPGTNFGIKRQVRWNAEMWVFGRNEASDWFQVYLDEPVNMIGWVWRENINLWGTCNNLPDTTDNLEPETPPRAPRQLELPNWLANLSFGENDRLYYLNPGMVYLRRQSTKPLLQLHMVIANLSAPELEPQVYIGAVPNNSATLVSEMVAQTGAFVAVNGDFYGGNYMPQGLTVIDGEVVTAPKYRATFALTEDNEPFIGYFTTGWTWNATVEAPNRTKLPLQLMNLPCDPRWLCLFSDALGGVPVRPGFDGIRAMLNSDLEVESITQGGFLEIPEGSFVLHGGVYTTTGEWIQENLKVGDKVKLELTTDPDWRDYRWAISGGPLIVRDSTFYQDCDPEVPEAERACEEFDDQFRNTHYFGSHTPRTAVGFNSDDNLLYIVMVEGYDIDHSDGMSSRDLADFFLEFKSEAAMEFDGGGSSSMWLGSNFVNDFGPRGERRVSNALMLSWNEEN